MRMVFRIAIPLSDRWKVVRVFAVSVDRSTPPGSLASGGDLAEPPGATGRLEPSGRVEVDREGEGARVRTASLPTRRGVPPWPWTSNDRRRADVCAADPPDT